MKMTIFKLLYRVIASVIVLFLINVLGGLIGFHLPINLVTVAITSVLSGYGVVSLICATFFLF